MTHNFTFHLLAARDSQTLACGTDIQSVLRAAGDLVFSVPSLRMLRITWEAGAPDDVEDLTQYMFARLEEAAAAKQSGVIR